MSFERQIKTRRKKNITLWWWSPPPIGLHARFPERRSWQNCRRGDKALPRVESLLGGGLEREAIVNSEEGLLGMEARRCFSHKLEALLLIIHPVLILIVEVRNHVRQKRVVVCLGWWVWLKAIRLPSVKYVWRRGSCRSRSRILERPLRVEWIHWLDAKRCYRLGRLSLSVQVLIQVDHVKRRAC